MGRLPESILGRVAFGDAVRRQQGRVCGVRADDSSSGDGRMATDGTGAAQLVARRACAACLLRPHPLGETGVALRLAKRASRFSLPACIG
ncbi:MAG: hypothetical protein OXN89_23870 [Bryobacterales bacterium]|nr:hypothetical protein [Bryobacterales bacterium]